MCTSVGLTPEAVPSSLLLPKKNSKAGFVSEAQPGEGALFVNGTRGFAPKPNACTFSHVVLPGKRKSKVGDITKTDSSL